MLKNGRISGQPEPYIRYIPTVNVHMENKITLTKLAFVKSGVLNEKSSNNNTNDDQYLKEPKPTKHALTVSNQKQQTQIVINRN